MHTPRSSSVLRWLALGPVIASLSCSGSKDGGPKGDDDDGSPTAETGTTVITTPPTDSADLVTCTTVGPRDEQRFDTVTLTTAGDTDRRFWGEGVVGGDFDRDGDVDLLVPGPNDATYLRNDAGTFVEDASWLPDTDWTRSAGGAAADFDEDGDLDVIVTRWGPADILLVNEGDRFTATPFGPEGYSQSATVADLDDDGHLDLVIAGHGQIGVRGDELYVEGPGDPTRLWLGDGAGGFTEATHDRLQQTLLDAYTFVVGVAQIDADPMPDLLFANDYPWWLTGMAALGRPSGWQRAEDSLGLNIPDAGMGLGIGDLNSDGIEDFVQPVWDRIVYLRSSSSGVWFDASTATGMTVPADAGEGQWVGWGAEVVDIDNDLDLDVVVAFGRLDTIAPRGPSGVSLANPEEQHYGLYLQDANGNFVESSGAYGLTQMGVYRGFVAADFDGNGWIDLARRDIEGNVHIDLARCGFESWLEIVPTPPHKAVGAVVTVELADRTISRTIRAGGTSLSSGGPPVAHFGLGGNEGVRGVTVRFPDGQERKLDAIATRRVVEVPYDDPE